VMQRIENGKKKADVGRKVGLVNSTIEMVCKNGTKIISAFEQNGSTIKQFRKPERNDVNEALLRWFQQERSDNVQYQ
jgi:lipoate-protein ligase A